MTSRSRHHERPRVQWHVSACSSLSSCLSFFTYSFAKPLLLRGRDTARAARHSGEPSCDSAPLDAFDIPPVTPEDDTRPYQRRLWDALKKSQGDGKSAHSFLWAVLSTHVWGHTFFLVVAGASRILGALLLGHFVELLEKVTSSASSDQMLACAAAGLLCLLSTWITSFSHHAYYFFSWRESMRMRIATVGMIYDKALRLSLGGLSRMTSGRVFNLAAGDSNRLQFGLLFIPYLFYAPIEAIVVLVFLVREIGVAALTGWLVFLFVFVPLQLAFSRAFSRLQFSAAQAADGRIKLTSEVIAGAACVKSQCWEPAFVDRIDTAREKELEHIRRIATFRGLNEGIFYSTTTVIGSIMFLSFTWTSAQNALPAKSVFVCLQLLLIMQLTVTKFWCLAVMCFSQAYVAMTRMGAFLEAEEVDESKRGDALLVDDDHDDDADNDEACVRAEGDEETSEHPSPVFAVELSHMTASWGARSDVATADASAPVLHDVSVRIRRNELCIIVGPVGSGKSSFLMALLGELRANHSPSVRVSSDQSIAYSAQDPHILSGTVEENILFGRAKDATRFQRVVRACALDTDLKSFSNGYLTLVGEKGVTLSGGQRSRIALARAAYAQADLVLLDDPLSAVDPHVAAKLINDVICAPSSAGGLLPATVILVTHQVQFLDRADRILVLDTSGSVAATGTYEEIKESGVLSRIQMQVDADQEQSSSFDQQVADIHLVVGHAEDEEISAFPNGGTARLRQRSRSVSVGSSSRSQRSVSADSNNFTSSETKEQLDRKDVEEKKDMGNVTWNTYSAYLSSIGGWTTLVPLGFMMVFGQGLIYFSSYVMVGLAKKSVMRSEAAVSAAANVSAAAPAPAVDAAGVLSGLSFDSSAILLCATAGSTLLVAMMRSVWFFRQLLHGSQKMHRRMLRSVMRAPMHFFDVNPSGRILNRFSTDLAFCDDRLPPCAFDFIAIAFQVTGTIVLSAVANPLVLLILLPLVHKFNAHRSFYMDTAREVKRIEALSRSPIFGQLSETLSGLVTIRAFREKGTTARDAVISTFKSRMDDALNTNVSHYFAFIATARYFGFRLDFFNHAFTLVCVSVVLILRFALPSETSEMLLDSSLVGLSVLYLMQGGDALQWCIRQSSEVENMMISVERIQQYVNLTPEAPLESQDAAAAAAEQALAQQGWPQNGAVALKRLGVKYGKGEEQEEVQREGKGAEGESQSDGDKKNIKTVSSNGAAFALRGVSVNIPAGAKVALVGRTGAGKSTALSALFRLVEPSEGSIEIDGVDLSTLGLHAARGAMANIPQSPWLFSGSIRANLDPFQKYSDERIWAALEEVQLKDVFEKDGLDHELTESGGNLSMGERQLVCLARALLSRRRVITLDEATANVDMATDRLIQDTVRSKFAGKTLIVIAHRLNTIIDADVVLVLDSGRLVEQGSPHELLEKEGSVFAGMCRETGEASERFLRAAAATAAAGRSDSRRA